jgi:hypothetical protein
VPLLNLEGEIFNNDESPLRGASSAIGEERKVLASVPLRRQHVDQRRSSANGDRQAKSGCREPEPRTRGDSTTVPHGCDQCRSCPDVYHQAHVGVKGEFSISERIIPYHTLRKGDGREHETSSPCMKGYGVSDEDPMEPARCALASGGLSTAVCIPP